MKVIIFLLCCVCGNYGENVTTVHFDIKISDDTAHCNPEVINGNRTKRTHNVVIETGKNIILNAGLQADRGQIQRANCSYNNGSGRHDLAEEYDIQQHNDAWFEEHEVTKSMYGKWSCRLRFNHNTKDNINPVDDQGYTSVLCSITVNNPDSEVSATTTSLPAALENKSIMDINNPNLWFVIGGVGMIVILIIIGQTIALCYFRKKAQPKRRMDKMTPSTTFDRGDRARYSAPPCRRSRDEVPECDRDSHIYELVVVNANYNKACELAAVVESETSIRNIRDRPPLPLPHEMEHAETIPRKKQSRMASMATSLRLSVTGYSNMRIKKKELPPPPVESSKKAPPRPPKQIDEESLPGSLKRPAKPAPAPASSSAPNFKSITVPKNTATKSPMSELKNIFKSRNIEKDTATSSPKPTNPTIENKNPPKAQTKPIQPMKAVQTKDPPITSKPAVQTNQMKLVLPKIETSLKTEPAIEPALSPTRRFRLVKKPQPTESNASQNFKWSVSTETQQAPKLAHVKPVKQSPIKNRPLPKPDSRPLPPDPVHEDMPIYQMADEDDTPDPEDDEEWIYEPLEQYHIYNM